MNTLHSTSATLASLNSANVGDFDGIGLRESPPLQPKTLKLCITPSPPPKMTEAKSSLGQTVLLQFMTGGRNPDIAHFASQCVPSDSSEEGDTDEDDVDSIICLEPQSDTLEENNKDGSRNNNNQDVPIYTSNRGARGPERSQSPKRPFSKTRQPGPVDTEPSRSENWQPQRQGKGKAREDSYQDRRGDDTMSLDEASPPPAEQQQQQQRSRSHEYERVQRQGQDHDRHTSRHHVRSSTEDSAPSVSLAAIALAAEGKLSKPGHGGSAERASSRPASSTSRIVSDTTPDSLRPGPLASASERARSRSPGIKRDHHGTPKPVSTSPGVLRLDSNVRSPQPEYSLASGSKGTLSGSSNGGGPSPNSVRQQYQGTVPLYPPHRDGNLAQQQDHQQRQSDQSQLLTPASAITPREMPSATSTTFPPIKTRDDRSVTGSMGTSSLATPASAHSPNDFPSPMPYSPNGAGIAASPAAFSPRAQGDFHLSRQSTNISLPSLASIHDYASPRPDTNNATSPHAANSPINHSSNMEGVIALSPANSSNNTGGAQPQQNLPRIREFLPLAGPLAESPTGSEIRRPPPPFIQPSPRFSQFPTISHSHHPSPTSPDEVYRRNSELGSPASSTGHAGSNQGNAPYYYPASGPPSSYGGSRRGTTEYGGDTPTSEPHYGTPGSTGRPAASPGRLLHPVMPSPLPASTILPLPAVRHEAIAPRQPPTIESLTGQPQHSPNGLSMHHQQHRPPPPPSHQPTQGPYQCEEPGCAAAPFPTQYLLNSHANVHSSNRPHYCPEPGCPRSKTGKGFKRKNEMIRHGLVHRSPGYVCPFCPDREHKYPRPDNLQRHVRVHHKDRNKDDPQLRDVLAQRADGPSRGRRRRL